MTRHLSAITFRKVVGSLVVLWALSISPLWAQNTTLLSQQMVEPYGLTRAWFNQIEINPIRNKILHVIVEGGTMFVVSSDAKLHAIDAETGQSLWIRSLGSRAMIFQEPAVNSTTVAVLNGLELFIFNRKNGKLLQQISLPGASSTGGEMSENYIYIPMIDNRMIAYPLITVDGPKIEEEGGAGSEDATQTGTIEESEEAADSSGGTEYEDAVLANIVKEFAKARDSIMAEAAPPGKEREIVFQRALGIPMTTITFGTTLVRPVLSTQIITYNQRGRINVHRETLVWVSQRGFLLAAAINSLSQENFELQYMIDSSSQTFYLGPERIARREWEANKELSVRPTVNQCVPAFYTENKPEACEIPSMVVCGGKAAYVFAVKDRTGEVAWQFAASGPIKEQIAVIGKDVYCCTDGGGMHALDIMDGKEQWYTPDICQFITASKKRLYTLDRRNRVVILDRQTGAPLNSVDARRFDRFLFNLQTDRIYVINESGLIQCLQERQPQTVETLEAGKKSRPLYHRLTCKEYADVLAGKPAPVLYWMEGGDTEDEAVAPAVTDRRRNSGDDGSLDGNDMEIDVKPKKKAETEDDDKEEKKDNDDPFS